ncbi:hypothetical protein LNP18_06165 [Leuconostoc citreum]|uniref:hypothetical protein n=1 Tax=Leuconostoc citreum TaxID=33964 RepID=UPI00200B49BC|nr:hypothetical protein [Leuconostoc citreum]MCK8605687.1 hypothetical protein [Leuconostoc citreum]
MSTRTAIFKEQADGSYQGIYCHHDGYIEGVGAMLNMYYQNPDKIQRVIDKGVPLSSIGMAEDVKQADIEDYRSQRDNDGTLLFCVYVNYQAEKFIADSLEKIRGFNYLTLTTNDEIDGYHETIHDEDVFVPYRGSDNNGYLYVQTLSGTWLVSYRKSNGDMTKFTPLSRYLQPAERFK